MIWLGNPGSLPPSAFQLVDVRAIADRQQASMGADAQFGAGVADVPVARGQLNASRATPFSPLFFIFGTCAAAIHYAAPIGGAKLVLPGPRLDGASLYELIEAEKVTLSAGVPTIWQALIGHIEQNGLKFSTMKYTAVGGLAHACDLDRQIFGCVWRSSSAWLGHDLNNGCGHHDQHDHSRVGFACSRATCLGRQAG